MKRILAATALVALCASVSFAGIKNTKHDLSSGNPSVTLKSGGAVVTTTDQICVFCHTPHNAIKSVPLWNRTNAAAGSTYKLYSSSSTLSYAKGAVLKETSLSLFCLSCHDGTVTQLGSRVVNNAKQTTGGVTMVGAWTTRGADTPALLGNDLTNDHPVGFAYPDTDSEGRLETAATALTKIQAARGAAPANSTKAIFFTTGGVANQMECSSCHLVHDNSNTFFLRATNTGSALCIACHKK